LDARAAATAGLRRSRWVTGVTGTIGGRSGAAAGARAWGGAERRGGMREPAGAGGAV